MVEITEFIFAMRPLNAQPLRSNNAALHTKSPPPHPATNRIPFRSDLRSNPTFSPTATTSKFKEFPKDLHIQVQFIVEEKNL
ncbi:hypothetical protein HN51_041165 [Arachis hypogaea]